MTPAIDPRDGLRERLADVLVSYCPNCDGRRCMGCVFREYDHACGWNCPDCAPEVAGEPHTHRTRMGYATDALLPVVEAYGDARVAEVEAERDEAVAGYDAQVQHARNWHVQYEHMKAERDMYRAEAALAEAGEEALTGAFHPEFGTEWREPDGIIYKAVQEARLEGRREAAREALSSALAGVTTHNGQPVTPKNLRWAATHEALCRSYIFDVLTGLADALGDDNGV